MCTPDMYLILLFTLKSIILLIFTVCASYIMLILSPKLYKWIFKDLKFKFKINLLAENHSDINFVANKSYDYKLFWRSLQEPQTKSLDQSLQWTNIMWRRPVLCGVDQYYVGLISITWGWQALCWVDQYYVGLTSTMWVGQVLCGVDLYYVRWGWPVLCGIDQYCVGLTSKFVWFDQYV